VIGSFLQISPMPQEGQSKDAFASSPHMMYKQNENGDFLNAILSCVSFLSYVGISTFYQPQCCNSPPSNFQLPNPKRNPTQIFQSLISYLPSSSNTRDVYHEAIYCFPVSSCYRWSVPGQCPDRRSKFQNLWIELHIGDR